MSSGKLDNPACKLDIRDITNIRRNEDGSWIYSDSVSTFKIHFVWIQGTIGNISLDRNEIYLREDNKTVIVSNCKNIPGGNEWMEKGQYIMVFGEIQAVQILVMNVRAVKISNLSDNPVFKKMWPHEIKEAKLVYSELQRNKQY